MIFDSVYNPFRGIEAYFKVVNGKIKKGEEVKFMATQMKYNADEIGVLRLKKHAKNELIAGEVGYIISGIKDAKVDGDYIMHHIQDDRVFEIFNPLDWNDANGDHYYFTNKVKLDKKWNQLNNIPIIGDYFNWMWDPSISLAPSINDRQLKFNKQFIMILISSILIIALFTFGYDKKRVVQTGIGNLLEVFVVFIRDDIVYPNMGEKQGKRFLPLILTFFFFIVTLNLLGLIPGSATATASFSVTVALALVTFFTYLIFGNKDFWKHIFATPGVPFWLLPIMIPVEIIGLITKPFALSVRLLANMNAGHIII